LNPSNAQGRTDAVLLEGPEAEPAAVPVDVRDRPEPIHFGSKFQSGSLNGSRTDASGIGEPTISPVYKMTYALHRLLVRATTSETIMGPV
jgi:hypothetical protein